MATTLTIPYHYNKDNSILTLLGFLKDAGYLKMESLEMLILDFRNGHDLEFDIPDKDLPRVLRHISDNGFVYKPEHLKKLESNHLNSVHSYLHVIHRNYTADITVFLDQTKKSVWLVTVSDNALSDAEKASLSSAIKNALPAAKKEEVCWDINVKRVSCSTILTHEALQYIGQKWTTHFFKRNLIAPDNQK